MKSRTAGLTLAETIIALGLFGIVALMLLLLFSRGTHVYTAGRQEQESLMRIRSQILPLLNEIRGATTLKSVLPAGGASSLAFNYKVNVGGTPVLKWVQLAWDSNAEMVTRTQRGVINAAGDPDLLSPPEETRVILSNLDHLNFKPDPTSPQILHIEYRLAKGLPVPLEFRYKLVFTPKLPSGAEEE